MMGFKAKAKMNIKIIIGQTHQVLQPKKFTSA